MISVQTPVFPSRDTTFAFADHSALIPNNHLHSSGYFAYDFSRQAEPRLLENHILVKRNRVRDYAVLQKKLLELLSYHKTRSNGRAYLLITPHCCQTSPIYLEHMKLLGAEFSEDRSVLADNYPFIDLMKVFIKKHGLSTVSVLNPVGLFRDEEASGRHVYFQNDPHLNCYGQALLGEWLCRQIRQAHGK